VLSRALRNIVSVNLLTTTSSPAPVLFERPRV
jgi:hypothetical protein